jgi:hypothetical protein
LGDVRHAVESAREALKLSLAQGDRDIMAEALGTLAEAEAAGRPARAAQLLGAADALREEIGVGVDGETAAAIRAGAGDETYERAYAAGRALSLAQALELALD